MSDMQQTDENKDEVTPESLETPHEEQSSESFGALKCYFYTPKRGDVRGAFCLLFGEDGVILDDVFWATRDMTGIGIDVAEGWRTLNKSIPVMGAYEKSLGEKLNSVTLEVLTPALRAELLQSEDTEFQLDELGEEFCKAFERATHCFMEIKLRLERLSRQDLVESGVLMAEKDPEEETESSPQAEKSPSFPGTLITCVPVIDPARGKPVSELVPGDLLNVKIQGGVGTTELIQKYLTSTSQEAVFPIETIERKDDEKTYVLLSISEELRGLVVVTKDLRLDVVQHASIKKRLISVNLDNVIFFGTLAISLVMILIAVRLLFF
ncbi:MAG: hypothetical protein LBO82_04200 [Synergistaceae bacterium]|jgi:hypothetical protein|nr:hypothetical protein [Synergistaceae bacterium]